LQPGSDGLGDAGTAGLLRLLEKVERYFHGDLARCLHNSSFYTILKASIEYGISDLMEQQSVAISHSRIDLQSVERCALPSSGVAPQAAGKLAPTSPITG
jgi:hypothetical protein